MRDESRHNLRVGLLVSAAVVVLGLAILAIGDRRHLFSRQTRYFTDFSNVTGLQTGAPVRLDGVTVGSVEKIVLPPSPEQQRIAVRFTLDSQYTERIREDTRVSIKTIGLLGDKYLEIKGGSPSAKRVLEGGKVEGKDPAEVALFVDRGEDVMENILSISSSLKVILRRVEGGQGLIGEMTTSPDTGREVVKSTQEMAEALRDILQRIDRGEGVIGRLLRDDALAKSLLDDAGGAARAVRDAATVLSKDLHGEATVYAALMRDPEGAKRLTDALDALRDGSQALAAATRELTTGQGTLPRLLSDKEYATEFLADMQQLVRNLRSVSEKLDQGTGTAGALVNDPQMYKDLEDVVRGVRSSKVLSWFIRNRRDKGEALAEREQQPPAGDAKR